MEDNLKGLSKAQLRDVAKKLNIPTTSKTTAQQIKTAIGQDVAQRKHSAYKGEVAGQVRPWSPGGDVDRGKASAAAASAGSKAISRLDSAINEVKATSPAKQPRAKSSKPVDSMSKLKRGVGELDKLTNQLNETTARVKAAKAGKLDYLKPGPGQPSGTLTRTQQVKLIRDYGLGGAMVGSQMPTYDEKSGKVTPSARSRVGRPQTPETRQRISDGIKRSREMKAYRAEAAARNLRAMAQDNFIKGSKTGPYMVPDYRPPSEVFTAGPAKPSLGSRIANTYNKVNTPLAVASFGINAGRAFRKSKEQGESTGTAVKRAAIEAAPAAAVLAAPTIAKGAGAAGNAVLSASGAMLRAADDLGMFANAATGYWAFAPGLATGAVGVGLKGIQYGAKALSKFALPVAVGMGATVGAMGDKNKVRGAFRGAINALDPTSIFMDKGIGQRGFDAAFGGPEAPPSTGPAPKRLTSSQESKFAQANTAYKGRGGSSGGVTNGDQMGDPGVFQGGRGFANPNTQKAAQAAKGREWSGNTR